MKKYLIAALLMLSASAIYAQKEKADIVKGNQLYQQQKYKEAEESYRNAVAKKDQNVPGNFNLGDALYKQKNYKDAQSQFNKIATSATDKKVAADAYYNLGNSLMQSKKLDESIAAYKKALINNPKDDQTRYNLAYAQKMQQKQKDQDKKNNDNKDNKDNKNQDKQDQNKDQNKDNKDNKDKKDQDKKDQDKKDGDKKDQDKKDQQGGQQPNKISKDDAERMLEALNNQEKQTQDKLKNKKLKGVKGNISKDW